MVFSRFLEVDIDVGVIIGMLIVLFYAVLGGMKGITYTQVAQYCVLIFAFMVPAIFISFQMTGNPIPQLGFGSQIPDGSGTYLLDKLDGLISQVVQAVFHRQRARAGAGAEEGGKGLRRLLLHNRFRDPSVAQVDVGWKVE